ncbi:hypothetical protein [Oribacterium sp. P6A1]|uniref:hypothetical protein n=1 Tax=Oribacterium sp. P6A1 TaxID=1410612 RepID=UPI00056568B9|nr:hypothetical protein [Oribacterium sp. P6A1]
MEENLTHNSLDFLKKLNKYTLDSKLMICQKYSSRIMSLSEVDFVKAYNENIMPWEIEAFAAYSIVYDDDNATEALDIKTFGEIITLIRNYWHSGLTTAEQDGRYPEIFMMISALQQFPVQGVFLQKLFRYHYFFTFQNEKVDMKKIFYKKIGVDYERFEVFAFLVFLSFSKEAQNKLLKVDILKLSRIAFSDNAVFKELCIEKEEYKKKLASLYKDNVIDQYYGLKIQYVYPFISGVDFIYAPSPYLVINAVTESMLNRITYNDIELRRLIGKEVIENYLYDILSQLDTATWISSEIKYNKGKDIMLSPDVITAEGDNIVFYDTKAITPSLKLRKFDAKEITKDIDIYAEDVIQIYNQIQNYLQGLFLLDKEYTKTQIFGIVVVLEDAVVSRKRVYDKVFEIMEKKIHLSDGDKGYICSHIKIISLRAIECMVLQNTSILPELISQLDKPERWYDYTYENVTSKNGLNQIYESYERSIKNKIKQIMKECV